MRSPFPGMDPYLEEPSGWTSVHHRLITVLGDMLTEQVAPAYYVAIKERVYITDPDDPIERQQIAPDLYLVERPTSYASSVSIKTITPPTIVELLPTLEVHDRYLEIRDQRSREVVTTIEVLSPRNKAGRSKGRKALLAKRQAVFAAQTRWIELDLLRAGERPKGFSKTDYYALLRPSHGDVALSLQEALDTVYARARYAHEIDYARPVPPPFLAPADSAWASSYIAAWQHERASA